MTDPTTTRPSLLLRIRDHADVDAWEQFVEIYAPVIFRFARRKGIQEADAADLTQDVLREVSKSIGKLDYDPKVGRFRSWLYKVTHYRFSHWCKQQTKAARGTGDSEVHGLLDQLPSTDEKSDWDRDYQQGLFEWAAARVRSQFQESTWLAFWKSAVEGLAPKEVAVELGLSVGAVYISRNRVIGRIRQLIQQVDEHE